MACQHEGEVMEYFRKKISEKVALRLEKHIPHCKFCAKRLEYIKMIDTLIADYLEKMRGRRKRR